MPSWLSESIKDDYLLSKAESNLKEFLESDDDPKIKADITKFVAKGLNKSKWGDKESSPILNVHVEELVLKLNDVLP